MIHQENDQQQYRKKLLAYAIDMLTCIALYYLLEWLGAEVIMLLLVLIYFILRFGRPSWDLSLGMYLLNLKDRTESNKNIIDVELALDDALLEKRIFYVTSILYFVSTVAIYSLYQYYTANNHEALDIVVYIGIYSAFLASAYIVLLFWKWRKISNRTKVTSAIPYLLIFILAFIANIS